MGDGRRGGQAREASICHYHSVRRYLADHLRSDIFATVKNYDFSRVGYDQGTLEVKIHSVVSLVVSVFQG